MKVNKAQTAIAVLSAASVILSILLRNEAASAALVLLCALAAVCILYRHLPELSNVSAENPKIKTLRMVTVFNILAVAGLLLFTFLVEQGMIRLSKKQYSFLLPCIFAGFILVFGNIAPKLPFNRYTGLRLPWTVTDEETWLLAHRLLGYLSLPCGILCLAGAADIRASLHIPMAMLLIWIFVPAVLSGLFFWRKWRPQK